jgi:thiol-disulfide isomerase/thioredoxin
MKRIVIIMVSVMMVMGCQGQSETGRQKEGATTRAPEFTLVDVNGDTLRLSDYQNKVVIVDIWDTWCGPCRMEIPDFVQLQDTYGKQGFVVLGLAIGQEGIEKVRSFIRDYKINYPVAIINQKVLDDYGPVNGIPTTFVLNRKHQIVKKYVGAKRKEIFENDIQVLLKQ